ncbi:MAG: hypothetical protein C0484_08260 [Rhodospirillum sp.]|nr:hypothetical protein [Rhodospirillum sp.]
MVSAPTPPFSVSLPAPPISTSRPSRPFNSSLPPPPSSVLAVRLPMMRLLSVLPVPLPAPVSRNSVSTFAPRV